LLLSVASFAKLHDFSVSAKTNKCSAVWTSEIITILSFHFKETLVTAKNIAAFTSCKFGFSQTSLLSLLSSAIKTYIAINFVSTTKRIKISIRFS
jgi:hypothetical protein